MLFVCKCEGGDPCADSTDVGAARSSVFCIRRTFISAVLSGRPWSIWVLTSAGAGVLPIVKADVPWPLGAAALSYLELLNLWQQSRVLARLDSY